MKHLISILLICSIGFTQELTVEGDLNVTGNIQSQTIDSLLQVIADLQSQLSDLQVENKLETRLFQVTGIDNGDVVNLLTNSTPTLPSLDFYLIEIVKINGVTLGGGTFEVSLQGSVGQTVRGQYSSSGSTFYHMGGSTPFKNIFEQVDELIVWSSPNTGSPYDLTLAITASFPSDFNIQQRKTGLQSKDIKTAE